MQFSNFTRTETGNIILFKNSSPLQGITALKYYTDNSSGPFQKKEFRWSFNGDYWSSWSALNQGNISGTSLGNNPYLFLEIRYTSAGGTVTSFILNYDGAAQASTASNCPPDSNYIPADKSISNDSYLASNQCSPGEGPIDAATLCGKSCDYYLWRPNHKGTQPISSIADLQRILNNLSGSLQNSITGGQNMSSEGIGIFYDRQGQDLLFRTIDVSGGGIEIAEQDGVIYFTVDASFSIDDASINELYQFYYSLESDLNDLSIYVDTKFFSVDSSIIRIDGSINDLYSKLGGDSSIYGLQNIGGDASIYSDTQLGIARLRTIRGAGGVKVYVDGDNIIIDASVAAGVLWTDDSSVSATVGGIKGTSEGGSYAPVGDNAIQILEDMLYEYFPPDVIMQIDPSPGPTSSTNYYEKWVISTVPGPFNNGVSLTYSFNNNNFTKVRVYDISIYENGLYIRTDDWAGSSSIPPYTTFDSAPDIGTASIDLTYSFQIGNKAGGQEMPAYDTSIGIRFVDPYFYGVVDDTVNASNITNLDILGLNKIIVPEQANEINYDVSSNYTKLKFVYAYPSTYSDLRSIFDVKNDFNVTSSFDSSIVNVKMSGMSGPGPNVYYKVYIKSHWISFTPDVSIFKLIFNI